MCGVGDTSSQVNEVTFNTSVETPQLSDVADLTSATAKETVGSIEFGRSLLKAALHVALGALVSTTLILAIQVDLRALVSSTCTFTTRAPLCEQLNVVDTGNSVFAAIAQLSDGAAVIKVGLVATVTEPAFATLLRVAVYVVLRHVKVGF